MEIVAIEPTVLLVRQDGKLVQLVDLVLRHDGEPTEAILHIRWDWGEETKALRPIRAGEARYRFAVPELPEVTDIRVGLECEGAIQAQHAVRLTPARHWEVHLVHISHHDWGYTDLPSNLWREYDQIIGSALRYCAETDGWPEEARFRYTVEQGWSALHFLEAHPEQAEELIRRVLEGRIEITALYANEITEMCGHEELIRLLYPTFSLRRRYGIPIRTALHNDIPGVSWGLALVLAGAGIEYFAPGLPNYFEWGGLKVHGFWDERAIFPNGEPGFFRWEAPDGSWLWFWYSRMWQAVLDYPEGFERIARYLVELQARDYPLDVVRIGLNGGARDNAHPSIRYSTLTRDWNQRYAFPRLILSSNAAFFDRAVRKLGDRVPVFRGDLPNTDYTVGATCTALETGINRMTHDHLMVAEKFATLATQIADYPYPRDHLARAYQSTLLFDDHTWGLHRVFGPAQAGNLAEKTVEAYRAAALAHDVVSKSLNRIADQVALVDAGYYLVVFNALNWDRTEIVQHQASQDHPCGRPLSWTWPQDGQLRSQPTMRGGGAIGRELVSLPAELLDQPLAVLDVEAGKVVPHQVVELTSPDDARVDAARRYAYGYVNPATRKEIRFRADSVPALGYRAFRIMPRRDASAAPGVRVEEYALENRFYRVEVDRERGTIASVYDKDLGRELVDGEAPHRFNEFIAHHPVDGREERPEVSTVQRGVEGPVCGSLIVRGSGAGCPTRVQEITLYAEMKRIDVANRLLRDATPLLEIYFAFPFQVERPQFRYEGPNAVIEPLVDQLPGTNSDSHAVQHWATIFNDEFGVTWSSREAPIVCFGGLWSGYVSQAHHGVQTPGFGHPFLKPGELHRASIYSYVMNNNFRTNFQSVQVADLLFRYSFTSYRGNWREGACRSFGWRFGNPLETVCVRGPQPGSLPASGQLCHVEGDNVVLLTLKPAEDGRGLIARVIETEGKDSIARICLPFYHVSYAVETSLVEEDQRMLAADRHTVTVPVRAWGITTVRCVPETTILPG